MTGQGGGQSGEESRGSGEKHRQRPLPEWSRCLLATLRIMGKHRRQLITANEVEPLSLRLFMRVRAAGEHCEEEEEELV